jgi:YidC/Oxa1 family membrane protein insertase
MIGDFFRTFVHDPLYNALIALYDTISFGDFGIAIILLTVLVKFAFLPLSRKQIESQKSLQELQPKVKEIQKKYKNDREKQSRELMALYKREKVNPFGGCLPLIVQLVFFIAIYRILTDISEANFVVSEATLYTFVPQPETVNALFLGIIPLTEPNVILAVITAIAQYVQMKMLLSRRETEKKAIKKEEKGKELSEKTAEQPDFSEIMNKQMLYLFPALTLFIGFAFGAGLVLFWLASTLFMIAQQWYIMKKQPKSA